MSNKNLKVQENGFVFLPQKCKQSKASVVALWTDSCQHTPSALWSKMVTPAPTITSALQLKRMRKREERSSWPLPSGILSRNYKCCFCLMTLSQNLGTGPLWAAKGMTLQPVKIKQFYYWGKGGRTNIGGHLALSATFRTLLYFTVEKLASTSPPNYCGTEATQQKRLTCHP